MINQENKRKFNNEGIFKEVSLMITKGRLNPCMIMIPDLN